MLFAAACPLMAQSVKFGLSAGVNESTNSTYQGSPTVISGVTGFNGGVFAEFDKEQISFEPGLFYSVKGYGSKTYIQYSSSMFIDARGKVVLNYLELPFNALYNIRISSGSIFIGGGPYFAYAMSGHANGTTSQTGQGVTNTQSSNNNSLFSSGSPFIRTDIGLNALAGVKFKTACCLILNMATG